MPVHYHPNGRSAAAIAAAIEDAARDGRLAPGDHLPPVRTLAAETGAAPGTVAAAYRLLRERGLTIADGRRGTRLRERSGAPSRSADSAALPTGVADFSTGNPDPALLPDLAVAMGAAANRLASEPPTLYGAPPLTFRLAALARSQLGNDQIDNESLTVTFGALDAIERVLRSHLRPGDMVAMEDPGWASLLDLVSAHGWKALPVAVDDEGPVAGSLERALGRGARALVLTSRAENPFGSTVSHSRALELRELTGRHPELLVIEDDHGYGIVGSRLCPTVGTTSRWAFVRSVAKALGPDLRMAIVAGDPATIDAIDSSLALGPGWVSHVVQAVVCEIWASEATAPLLERAAETYDSRRRGLLEALAARGVLGHGATGLNCWIPVSDEPSAVGRILRGGYLVAPGSRFRMGAPPAIRVTTAAINLESIPELADVIADAVTYPLASAPRRIT